MAVDIKSKHAVVSKPPFELYMAFVDMRNFVQFLPEDKKEGATADFKDEGAPFAFSVSMHFDAAQSDPYKTEFYIELSAELNLMMKMMLGSKLKDALDKMVDGLVAVSEGRMPEGVDPSMFKDGRQN